MKLNEPKAIAGVPRLGPNSLYKYFINTHHLRSNISKEKNIKI